MTLTFLWPLVASSLREQAIWLVFTGVVTVPLFILWAIQVEACPAGFRSGKLRNRSDVAELHLKTLLSAKRTCCGTFLDSTVGNSESSKTKQQRTVFCYAIARATGMCVLHARICDSLAWVGREGLSAKAQLSVWIGRLISLERG